MIDRELFAQDNKAVRERFKQSMDRVGGIGQEWTVAGPFDSYFEKLADFIVMIEELYETVDEGCYRGLLLSQLE